MSNAASIFAAVRQMPAPPCYVTGTSADAVGGGGEQATIQPRRTQSSLKKSQPTFDFRSRAEKRLSFTLVFQTLKCEIINTYSARKCDVGIASDIGAVGYGEL